MKDNLRIGIVQEKPVFLDLKGCMDKATRIIADASANETELLVFGETWITGYPAWLDSCPGVNYWDHDPVKKVYTRLYQNSVRIPGKETNIFCKLAKEHKMAMVIGLNEVVGSGRASGSIYNSLIIINEEGKIANHHRKLVPTFTEKLVWAPGDGKGLNSVETQFGTLGGLICWEHWMPLTRYAMHEAGEHYHVAAWPTVHEKHQIASRHYAFEGRCIVIAAGQMMQVKDLPDELPIPDNLSGKPEEYILNGGSCIIGPDGSFILEPQLGRDETIYFEIEGANKVIGERMTLDVTGHYNRPDVFNLEINRERK